MSTTPELRPVWQQKRGERFGNLRRQMAEMKIRARRNVRAENRQDTQRQIKEEA